MEIKFILNGKLIIVLYKHMEKTTLLMILIISLKLYLVIHIHTKLNVVANLPDTILNYIINT
jgi:hypothetical protein